MYQSSRSPIIEMQLITDGRRLEIAKSAGDYLILNEPANLPPGEAEMIITVDDEPTKFQFMITEPVNGVRVEVDAKKGSKTVAAQTAVV